MIGIEFFNNIYNKIDFFFRQKIKIKRKYTAKSEPKLNLCDNFPTETREIAQEKEKYYLEKYCLQSLKQNSTCRNYLENLATIELLENFIDLSQETNNKLKILDIGSKNWFYVSGEFSFFKYKGILKEVFLDGIEIDAFRVYSDLHTRYDYAQFYMKNLENTRYITKDFLEHNEKYDYITWFFPFVTKIPHQKWGLPLSKFKPPEMLNHAYNSLNPNGRIIIVNQDEKEYIIQEDLIRSLNLTYEKKGCFKNSFLEYEHDRYITIVSKE